MMMAIAKRALMDSLTPAANGQSAWFTASQLTLVGTLLVAPLAFGAVQPWAWAAMCILCGFALMLWVAGCAVAGRIRIQWSPLYAIALLALALVASQLLFGKTADPIGTREALIKLVGYCVIAFLAGQLATNLTATAWRRLGFAMATYVFAVSVFAIVQFFSNSEMIYWAIKPRWGGWVFGPYVNHNHYAGLLEIILPLATGALLALPERHAFKFFGAFAVLLGVASVILSGSRGGTIAIIIELGIFLSVIIGRAAPHTRKSSLMASVAMIALVAALFIWLDSGAVRKRWGATMNSPEVATGARLSMLADSARMMRQYPVSGVGAGTFAVAYPSRQSWFTGDLMVDHAHNDYAELLAETGIAGGALLVAFVFLLFRQGLADSRQSVLSTEGWIQIGAMISCCGFLLHSFTEFNLHIPANAAWFAFAVAGTRRSSIARLSSWIQ